MACLRHVCGVRHFEGRWKKEGCSPPNAGISIRIVRTFLLNDGQQKVVSSVIAKLPITVNTYHRRGGHDTRQALTMLCNHINNG